MAQRKYAVKNVLAPDDLDEFTLVRKEIDAVLARAALCVVPCVRFSMVVLLVLVIILRPRIGLRRLPSLWGSLSSAR